MHVVNISNAAMLREDVIGFITARNAVGHVIELNEWF